MRVPSDRPTLIDVAARAGVSTATASRALSGRSRVASTTAAAVKLAAQQLGYVDSSPRAGRVAVLTGGYTSQLVEAVSSVTQGDEDAPGTVVVTSGRDLTHEIAQLSSLLTDPGISAVIIAGGRWDREPENTLLREMIGDYRTAGKPLVFCGRPALAPGCPELVVDYDNHGGGRAAAAFLAGQGHRQVLLLRGPLGFTTSDQRVAGFLEGCHEFGVEVATQIGHRGRDSGVAGLEAALAAGTRFTAVFGESDQLAVGAMAVLAQIGRRVPEDVSVMGFDDMRFTEDLRVPLTTVRVPFVDVGRTALALALDQDQVDRATHVVAGTHIVVRQSTAPLSTLR